MTQFFFGPYRFDTNTGELFSNDERINLRNQLMKALSLLLEKRGELVTREELREQLWGDKFVVEYDMGISACMRELRKALSDSASNPQYIQTVPKRGYRFLVETRREGRQASQITPEYLSNPSFVETVEIVPRDKKNKIMSAIVAICLLVIGLLGYVILRDSSRQNGPRLVAILPFENIQNEPQWDLMRWLISDRLISYLSAADPNKLAVIGRTSIKSLGQTGRSVAQLGQDLGVDYVIEGSFRQHASLWVISINLVGTDDQLISWSKTIELEVESDSDHAKIAEAIGVEIMSAIP